MCVERAGAPTAVVLAEVDLRRPGIICGHQQRSMTHADTGIQTEANEVLAVGLNESGTARKAACGPSPPVAAVAVGADHEHPIGDVDMARVEPAGGITTRLAPVE